MEEGNEIITLGDCNLDRYQWDKPENQLNTYQKSQRPMVESLKEKILNIGNESFKFPAN